MITRQLSSQSSTIRVTNDSRPGGVRVHVLLCCRPRGFRRALALSSLVALEPISLSFLLSLFRWMAIQDVPLNCPNTELSLSHNTSPIESTESPRGRVLAFIETTLSGIVGDIQVRPYGRPSIYLKRITNVQVDVDPVTQTARQQISDKDLIYSFPGRNKDEAWRFGASRSTWKLLFRVLTLHELAWGGFSQRSILPSKLE